MSHAPRRASGTLDQADADVGALDAEIRRRVLANAGHVTALVGQTLLADHVVSTSSELDVLMMIRLDGPQRPRELAALTGMTRAGTTNLVDRLEQWGLASRTDVVSDRRGVLVQLTRTGVRTVDAISDRLTALFASLGPSFERWRDDFDALGIPTGELLLPSGDPDTCLRYLSRFSLGHVFTPLYERAFGGDRTHAAELMHLLLLTVEPGGTRPSLVADELVLSSASTSDLLARAEALGLIERVSGQPPDRRLTTVTPTERGRDVVDVLVDASDDAVRAIAHALFPT